MPASDWIVEDAPSPYLWYFNDLFDDGNLDIATEQGTEGDHEYSSTIQNGFMLEEDGYLKTEVNDLGKVGYSRFVHTTPMIMQPHQALIRATFVVHTWNTLSDIALGFSFERTVGNTAYRGDLALWIDYNIAKLYYRATRTSPVTTVNLDYIYLKPDETIELQMTYNQGIVEVKANHEGIVQIVHTEDVGKTYEDNPVYEILGGRGSGEVTELWVDNFKEIVGKAWSEQDKAIGNWTVVRP